MNDLIMQVKDSVRLKGEIDKLKSKKRKINSEIKKKISETLKNLKYEVERIDLKETKRNFFEEYESRHIIYYPVLKLPNGLEKINLVYCTDKFDETDYLEEKFDLLYNDEIILHVEAEAFLYEEIYKDIQINICLNKAYITPDVKYRIFLPDGTKFEMIRVFNIKEYVLDKVNFDKKLELFERPSDYYIREYNKYDEIYPEFVSFFRKHGLENIVSYKDLKKEDNNMCFSNVIKLLSGNFLRYKMYCHEFCQAKYSNDEIVAYIMTDIFINIVITKTDERIMQKNVNDLLVEKQSFEFLLWDEINERMTLREIFETFGK